MITSRDQSSWIIPGGGIEQNETINDAAHRELYEEAGVKGRILRHIGLVDNFERKRRTHIVVIYAEHEHDNWEENILFNRQRHWFHLNEVRSILTCCKKPQLNYFEIFITKSPNSIHTNESLQHKK